MVMRTLTIAVASILLAACTVGPDYVRPTLPAVDQFSNGQSPQLAGETAPAVDLEFWRSFGDPVLERLVDQALVSNHDLRIALARYEQANALLRNAKYDRLPTLGASAEASDSRSSSDQLPGVGRAGRDSDQYSAGFSALWELDFFGRIRRSVEAQHADTEASAADLAAVQVVLVGDLAETYFGLRGLQEQLRIAQQNADNQAQTLRLIDLRRSAGIGSAFEVDRASTQLESTRSRVPALQSAIAVSTHRIAVLAGQTPESVLAGLDAITPLPSLPETIATGTPAELLRRRPDVTAAERRLGAATARVGVATADLFPRFTLGGLIGSQALDAGALFERDSETRLIAFGIDGSFLNVGRVRSRIAAANAATAADLAAYEQTVLLALEETENALVRVSRSAEENAFLERAAAAGARATAIARLRYDNGAIDVLDVLESERASLQAEDAFAQGRVRNTLAVVSLYKALAGGWPQYVPKESTAVR
ncbi:RND transporter [Pseudoxanthomonas gei]|uniref:RND transporter n=1 Tax=Pseudoxanthomonas gei TaxID=1383030 RepID=A0ABX0A7L5_9GAMM|nr:efflux transporter outer membrane subunit [Pseudoxanthomonas gei]NDK37529.1 RND transporter [Pseudoxanthomonas gei]